MPKVKIPYLHFSVRLLNYLTEMSEVNPIAKILLEEVKDSFKEEHPDYFDISHDDKKKLSYLNDDRRKNLQVSEYFTPNLRYHTSPGKLLNKLLLPNIKESVPNWNVVLEEFSNMFQALACFEGKSFELWEGEDIRKAYLGSNYMSGNSSLNGSCMKSPTCQPYLDMFVFNPTKIKLLVLLSKEREIAGRALVWHTDAFHKIEKDDKSTVIGTLDNAILMDRVYCADECDFELFYSHAKQKRWYRKQKQNYRTPTSIQDYRGTKGNYEARIKLIDCIYDKYPYMDSLMHIHKNSDGSGELHNNMHVKFDWALRSTSGSKTTHRSWSESFIED